jgi:hypothetical protein
LATANNLALARVVTARFIWGEPSMRNKDFSQGHRAFPVADGAGSELADFSNSNRGLSPPVHKKIK